MTHAGTLVPIEKYLRRSYRPDRDFVDGRLVKRNLGEYDHSRTKALLIGGIVGHGKEWETIGLLSVRVRVAPQRVRVADICVLRRRAPREQVIVTPPLLCVEVLSPKDRLTAVMDVLEDYARMGVENTWVIDPGRRAGYVYGSGSLIIAGDGRLEIQSTDIVVDLRTLFADLD